MNPAISMAWSKEKTCDRTLDRLLFSPTRAGAVKLLSNRVRLAAVLAALGNHPRNFRAWFARIFLPELKRQTAPIGIFFLCFSFSCLPPRPFAFIGHQHRRPGRRPGPEPGHGAVFRIGLAICPQPLPANHQTIGIMIQNFVMAFGSFSVSVRGPNAVRIERFSCGGKDTVGGKPPLV